MTWMLALGMAMIFLGFAGLIISLFWPGDGLHR